MDWVLHTIILICVWCLISASDNPYVSWRELLLNVAILLGAIGMLWFDLLVKL